MFHKPLAALIALALLIGCLPALALAEGRSDSLVPDKLVAQFNVAIDYTLQNIGGMTQAEKDSLADFLRLAYTETTEEGNAFYDNADWSVEIAGEYGSRAPDTAQPAVLVLLTLHADGLDEQKMRLARVALAAAIRACDPSADFDALFTWITEATENGDSLLLENCRMELKRVEDLWIYTLSANEAGVALDDGDALKSLLSDYLDGEAGTPDATPAPTATPNPNLLVDWNGFSVELLRIEPKAFYDGTVDLAFYCRYVNRTDYEIDMFLDDTQVNGVAVDGIGEFNLTPGTDTGADSDEYFFVQPLDGDQYSAGLNAICNARDMKTTVRLKGDGQELCQLSLSLSLQDVPSFTPQPTASPTPAATSEGTSALDKLKAFQNAQSDPADQYDTLCRGDRGDGVAWMQMELIDLGYLSGEADGVFGAQTAEAVRLFNEANGFGSTEIATPEMQYCLFGNGPVPYEEPWVPLVFNSNATCEWKKYNGNKIGVRVEVTNRSRSHTVKAFDLYMYCEDIYGEPLYGEGTYYYGTTVKKVAPGKTVKSDYIVMPDYSKVARIYIAIKKVVFTDGEVRENDATDYWWWDTK